MGPMAQVNIVDCFGPNVTPELRKEANHAIQLSMDHTAMLFERRRGGAEGRPPDCPGPGRRTNEQLSEEPVTLFSAIFGSGASTASIAASGLMSWPVTQVSRACGAPRALDARRERETLRYRPAITGVGQKASTTSGLRPRERGTPSGPSAPRRDPRHFETPRPSTSRAIRSRRA